MQNVQHISPQGKYLSYIIPAGDADPSSRGTASVCALLSYGPLCAPIPPTSPLSSVLRLLFSSASRIGAENICMARLQ